MQLVGLLEAFKPILSKNWREAKCYQTAVHMQSITHFKTQVIAFSKQETNFVSWQAQHWDY